MKKHLLIMGLLLASNVLWAQEFPFKKYNARWVDETLKSMTLDEKVGQLLLPRGNFPNEVYDTTKINRWIQNYKIGGLVLFGNPPTRIANVINFAQQKSRIPMMIGMDLEWGLTHRIDSTMRYPYAMTLGAIQNGNELIYQMGREIGEQCRRIGVQINYAPDADVNNNPNNPVIGFRSFGENPEEVLDKSFAYMKGMQDTRLITSAKHFPGHGDTDVDSHEDLPLIKHDRNRLNKVELYPFRELIKRGITGVMIAHLNIPALDTVKRPTTISPVIVTELLRKQLGFKGLVFSDAMEMQGIAKFYGAGEAGVRALLAGQDVLETFTDVEGMFAAIKKAVQDSVLKESVLNEKVRRILIAKAWAGLDNYQPVKLQNLVADLTPRSAAWTSRQLFENAMTVVKNENKLLPVKDLANFRVASLSIGKPVLGTPSPTNFQSMLSNYTTVEHYNVLLNSPDSLIQQVKKALATYDLVCVGVHGLGIRPAVKLDPGIINIVNQFTGMDNAVYSVFGNPYTLGKFSGLEKANGLIMAYQETEVTQELAAQIIFGSVGAKGRLPVTVNEHFKVGDGILTEPNGRFEYTMPEAVGINGRLLASKLDSVVNLGLRAKAYPGGQLVVARNGKVIFQKAYGYHTYPAGTNFNAKTSQSGKMQGAGMSNNLDEEDLKGERKVLLSDVYDLASVTKVSTSAPALMKMQDETKFSLDMKMGDLIPLLKRSNKKDLLMRDVLTHQARLRAWIPFWKEVAQNADGSWKANTCQEVYSKHFPIQIAQNLFLHKKFAKQLFEAIKNSPLNEKPGYVYSDLSYYLYPEVIKRLTGTDFETYLKETFYKPLGANSLTFNAAVNFPLSQVVPTEYDTLFRKEQIHGRVHDEGAAMLGGISGHAGLFGNANDEAKLIQMYLNNGTYGGKRYLHEKTVKEWTAYGYSKDVNPRRGIAFDKPDRSRKGLSAAPSASEQSFGHSGYTGTFVWADPRDKMLYVFLSNRVFPTRNNTKISDMNIRTQIGEVIYECIRLGTSKK